MSLAAWVEKRLLAAGFEAALFRNGEEITDPGYARQPVPEGFRGEVLEPGAITWQDHLWRFELASGRCTSIPGARLPLYAAREEGGRVLVEVVPR